MQRLSAGRSAQGGVAHCASLRRERVICRDRRPMKLGRPDVEQVLSSLQSLLKEVRREERDSVLRQGARRVSMCAVLLKVPVGQAGQPSGHRLQDRPSQGRTLSKPRSRLSPCLGTCTGRPCGKPGRWSAACSGQRPPAGRASSHTVATLQAAEHAKPAHTASDRPSRAGP